jgi:hypothetical protein
LLSKSARRADKVAKNGDGSPAFNFEFNLREDNRINKDEDEKDTESYEGLDLDHQGDICAVFRRWILIALMAIIHEF